MRDFYEQQDEERDDQGVDCNGRCWEAPYPTCDCGARADELLTHGHVIGCPCIKFTPLIIPPQRTR